MKHFRIMLAAVATTILLTSTAALAQPSYNISSSCSWDYLRCVRAGLVDETVCYARYEECMSGYTCTAA